MSLEEIMNKWNQDKPNFETFRIFVHEQLERVIIEERGIFVRVHSRVKNDLSMAKKLLRKKSTDIETYESMNDRVGLRVICKYREDLEPVCEVIRSLYDTVKCENKSSILKINELGYRSLHIDIKIKEDTPLPDEYTAARGIVGEVQIRTMCEDVWAEIHHNLGYKPLLELDEEIARLLYCLSGLLEVADDSFSRIQITVDKMDELRPVSALRVLENSFLKLVPREFDYQLSLETLDLLLPLVTTQDLAEFKQMIQEFADRNGSKFKSMLSERESSLGSFLYLTQPEIFLIYYLVENDPYSLIKSWENRFPIEDLEKLALWWGKPLQDLISH